MKLDVKEKTACFSLLDEYFNRSTPTTTTAATPSNHLSTSLAQAALSNPTLSAAALRSSGLTPAQAKSASQFGAAHAETLAPYVAASASGVYQNRAAISNVAAGAYQKGQIPQGLSTKPGGVSSPFLYLVLAPILGTDDPAMISSSRPSCHRKVPCRKR